MTEVTTGVKMEVRTRIRTGNKTGLKKRSQKESRQESSVNQLTEDTGNSALAHLVNEVSIDTVGQLLDEGVHDELHVGACVGLFVLLFCTFTQNKEK